MVTIKNTVRGLVGPELVSGAMHRLIVTHLVDTLGCPKTPRWLGSDWDDEDINIDDGTRGYVEYDKEWDFDYDEYEDFGDPDDSKPIEITNKVRVVEDPLKHEMSSFLLDE